MFNTQRKETSNFMPNEEIIIKVKVKFSQNISHPVFGITIKDSQSNNIFFTNTHLLRINTGEFKKGDEKIIEYFLTEYFEEGKYYLSPAIAAKNLSKFYDWRENYYHFSVKNTKQHSNQYNTVRINIY